MKTAKRTLALLLTVCLLCSTLFTSAFAAEGDDESVTPASGSGVVGADGTGDTGNVGDDKNDLSEEDSETEDEEEEISAQTIGADDVAAIGDTGYETLADAITAVQRDETITLLDNVQEEFPLYITGEFTIDLAKYTLTLKNKDTIHIGKSDQTTIVPSGADITIKNGNLIATDATATWNSIFTIYKGSSITLDSVDYTANGSALFPCGDAAAVTVIDSTITCGAYAVGTNAGSPSNYYVQITLQDSTFKTGEYTTDSSPVFMNVPGTLNMDGCKVVGTRHGVVVRGGDATITDCDITVTGTYTAGKDQYWNGNWGGGNELPMAAILVGNRHQSSYQYPATCEVNNTKVTAENDLKAAYVYGMSEDLHADLSISGDKSDWAGEIVKGNSDEQSNDIIIDGGTYNTNVSEFVPAGMVAELVQDETGKYVVKMDSKSVASINGVGYLTLQAAIDAAEDNDTIKLLKDVELTVPQGTSEKTGAINISDKKLTIDGKGFTITAKTDFGMMNQWDMVNGKYHVINILNGADVTLKDLKVDGDWDQTADNVADTGNAARTGVNVYTDSNSNKKSKATLENVTIKNCSVYGLTVNSSDVVATGLIVEGNRWGVNVDSGSFKMDEGELKKDQDLVIENSKNSNPDVTIKKGIFNGAVVLQNVDSGAKVTIKDGTFKGKVGEVTKTGDGTITDKDPSNMIAVEGGEFAKPVQIYAKNGGLNAELKSTGTTPYSYYASVEKALENAESGDEITDLSPVEGEASKPIEVCTVTVTNDGKTVDSENILKGGTYTLPDAPSKSGYKFRGWSDGSKTYSAGEKVEITADTTFDAVWKKKNSSGGNSSSTSSSTSIDLDTGKNGDVSISPKKPGKGDKVTITVEPDDGYILDTIKVTDEDGDKIKLTEKGENKFTFTMPSGEVTIETTFTKADGEDAPKFSFIDVSTGDWFAPAVDYVSAKGMMNGSNGYFSPYDSLTRGMIAQILYNLEGGTGSFAIAYPDVSGSDWYANAVSWVSANGIMSGYGSGLFGANDSVTREQLALTLYSYAKAKGYNTAASVELTAFADGASTSEWAKPAMQWAVANGLFSGKTGNRLDPQGTATRAEVASILMRFCETIAK